MEARAAVAAEWLRHLLGIKGASRFGSASTAEDVTAGISLASYTAIVTGATSGIGLETARVLAKRGCHVIIPARSLKATERAKSIILKEIPDACITTAELDLGSFSSVRRFVADFEARNLPLNILINNAGILSHKFIISEDGFEMDFATNHLGHFLLTDLLLENLSQTAKATGIEGRIVAVSSRLHEEGYMNGIDFDKINDETRFTPMGAYGQSKLANLLHAKELARRLKDMGANVTVNALHPGVIHTNIVRDQNPAFAYVAFSIISLFIKTKAQGAATTCYLATHPDLRGISGRYFVDCNEASCSSHANDMNLAAELWNFSHKAVHETKLPHIFDGRFAFQLLQLLQGGNILVNA